MITVIGYIHARNKQTKEYIDIGELNTFFNL